MFFRLNQILRINLGIWITKDVCLELNRARGIRIGKDWLYVPMLWIAA